MTKKILTLIKSELPLLIAAFAFVFGIMLLSLAVYSAETVKNISSEVFRFHVLANSDSSKDQQLKLKVRDAVLKEMESELSKSLSKEETQKIMESNTERIKKCAEKVIKENGFDYKVSIQLANEYYPEKHYGDIRLPSGYYDGLKIMIGNAKGHNWWCVMYPPLCFVDTACVVKEADKTKLKDNLSEDDYRLITESGDIPVNIKFKLVEIFS